LLSPPPGRLPSASPARLGHVMPALGGLEESMLENEPDNDEETVFEEGMEDESSDLDDFDEAPFNEAGALQMAKSSVASIRWHGDEVVDKLWFVMRDEEDCADNSAEMLLLQPGEYVKALRGRVEFEDGRVADWVEIRTSRRKITIGSQGVFSPTFSYNAETGQELVGAEFASTGRLEGAQQRLLSFSPAVAPALPAEVL